MKKLITLVLLLTPIAALAVNGKLQRSTSEQVGNPPQASTTYDRDCAGNGKPRNLRATIATAASGVGSVQTITETDGTNIWVSTVDTSAASSVSVSCPLLQ